MKDFSDKEVEAVLDQYFSEIEVPEIRSKAAVWNELSANADANNQVHMLPFWMKMAASVVIILSLTSSLYFFNEKSIEAGKDKMMAHALPDGSKVSLNAGASIEYNALAWYINRTVALKGEGFFEVEKGRQFTVETNLGSVSVLGTSFNVKPQHGALSVACYSGKVAVEGLKQGQYEEITKGQRVVFNSNNITDFSGKFDLNNGISWITGDFEYRDEALSQVIADIESYYGVQIEMNEKINSRKYSGNFSKVSLKDALEIICLPLDLQYQITEEKVQVFQ